jgi:hypothetical protein
MRGDSIHFIMRSLKADCKMWRAIRVLAAGRARTGWCADRRRKKIGPRSNFANSGVAEGRSKDQLFGNDTLPGY